MLLNNGHIEEYQYTYLDYINDIQYIVEYDADCDYNYIHIIKFYVSDNLNLFFKLFFRPDSIDFWQESPKSPYIIIKDLKSLNSEEAIFQRSLVDKHIDMFSTFEYEQLNSICSELRKTLDEVTNDE